MQLLTVHAGTKNASAPSVRADFVIVPLVSPGPGVSPVRSGRGTSWSSGTAPGQEIFWGVGRSGNLCWWCSFACEFNWCQLFEMPDEFDIPTFVEWVPFQADQLVIFVHTRWGQRKRKCDHHLWESLKNSLAMPAMPAMSCHLSFFLPDHFSTSIFSYHVFWTSTLVLRGAGLFICSEIVHRTNPFLFLFRHPNFEQIWTIYIYIYIYRYWQVDKPKMRWVCVKTIQNPDSLLLSPVFIRNGSIGGMPHPQISHSWDDKSSASWPSPIDHGPYNGIHPKYADSGHSILYNHTTMVNLGSSPYFSLWNTQQLPTTPNFV